MTLSSVSEITVLGVVGFTRPRGTLPGIARTFPLAQWSRYARACDPINETLTRPHEPTFSNGIFWLRIVLLQFVSKNLSQMISDPQVYFHPILAARCRQAHNLLPDWSELTLLGSETPVHPRWHLDPGSDESRAGDSEQPRV